LSRPDLRIAIKAADIVKEIGMDNKKSTSSTKFTSQDINDLDVELKVGIIGTVNDVGLPHMTMISSLRPYMETGLVWGQFTEGLSKKFIQKNPKAGFLIMSLDRQIWRGKARFTHTANQGPEYENFNKLPMFRYNAYFGIHTVYYLELVELVGRKDLPMGRVVAAALQTLFARTLMLKHKSTIINPWIRGLFNKLDNLKFLGYVGDDGFPVVLPAIQAQVLDGDRVIFSLGAYKDELMSIPENTSMAVFGLSFSMEDVLLRGRYSGTSRVGGIECGVVEIDWIYNSMPPVPQQVYPQVDVEPITKF